MADQTIDRLQIEINAKSNASSEGVDRLSQSIQRLKSAIGGGTDKLNGIAASIEKLKNSLDTIKGSSGSVTSLSKALEKIQAINLNGVAVNLSQFSEAARSLNQIGAGLQSIRDFGKGVTSMQKSVEKLQKMDIGGIADKIKELVDALKPLTDEMIRAGSGMSNFGTQMKELAQATKTAQTVNNRVKNITKTSRSGFASLGSIVNLSKIGASIYVFRQVGSAIKGAVTGINDYIENINLFSVAMGDAAEEGQKFAQSMQDVLGINAGEAMRNMGLFQQLTTSFGVTSKQATILSKNFTQLGYDLSSFFNIPIEEAFQKLQSGLAGEIEPLRRIGIDVSVARLQQELYNLGINESVNNLNQADKALLRYIATMKQSVNAQGDMARTIMTPANALRVLQAQLQLTARAIGSIFIPALTAILPYVIAVVRVIGELAAALAAFLGFKMPTIDYSSINSAAGGVGDLSSGMEDLADNTADAKKQMAFLIGGFDELNRMDSQQSGTSQKIPGLGALGGIELPEYDMFAGAIENQVDKIVKKLKELWENFKADPITFLSDAIWKFIDSLKNLALEFLGTDFSTLINGISAGLLAYGLTGNPIIAIAVGALTAALSKFLPLESRIDLMSGTLANLATGLAINVLSGGRIKLPLAIGISSLLSSGLVKLLNKDRAINGMAATLTGLGAGLMAYTFTGNVGLAIAIGAITTAVSSLAIHKSTLKIAPALLTGVSAALAAFKWGKFSAGAAGIVGIGAAIQAFSQLNDISYPLQISLSALSGALIGLGTAIKLGFGPQGLAITAIVGAFIGLGAAIIQAQEDAKKADLESRFGNIKLSMEEVENVAKRLTSNPWTVKVDAAIEANKKIEEFEKNIQSSIEALNKLNWKVNIGLSLTDEEISNYKNEVDSFVKNAQDYVLQKQYAVDLAIDAILKPGTFAYENLNAFSASFYGEAYEEMNKLGGELSDIVNEAFADGILSDTEMIDIQEKQAELQKVIDRISDAEYRAKLKAIGLDAQETNLTAESFSALQKEIQESLNERLKSAEELRASLLVQADMQYPNGGADYDKLVRDIQLQFNQEKANIVLQGVNVQLDVLKKNYKKELDQAIPDFKKTLESSFNEGLKNAQITGNWAGFWSSIQSEFSKGSSAMSKESKQTLSKLLSELSPQQLELETLSNSYTQLGQAVPESISQGLKDIYWLQAISGNTDAIYKLLGSEVANSSEYLEVLKIAQQNGVAIPRQLLDSLELNATDAQAKAGGMWNTIQIASADAYESVKQSFSNLGLLIPSEIINAIALKSPEVQNETISMVQSLSNGLSLKEDELTSLFNTFGISIPDNIIQGIASKDSLVQSQVISSLSMLNSGISLKQPELESLFNNLGMVLPKDLISSLASYNSPVQSQAIILFSQLGKASESEKGGILSKIRGLGIDVGNSLESSIGSQETKSYKAGKNLLDSLWDGLKSAWSSIKNWFNNLSMPSFTSPYSNGYYDSDSYSPSYYSSEIPAFAKGGVAYRPMIAKVGDNKNARTDPEIIAPQSMIGEAVVEANGELASAIYQMAQMIVSAIENNSERPLEVDGTVLTKKVIKGINSITNNTGRSPLTT